MATSITQDMKYRQSLMKYAAKYGVSRASRKYNKSRSYIYFWKKRWDGTVESLGCQSRRPHRHPTQHTEAELKLIRDMRRRNPKLGMVELWHRLRKRGYTRRPESLFRVMRKIVCPRCRKFVHAYNKFRQFKFDFPHLKSAVGLIKFLLSLRFSHSPFVENLEKTYLFCYNINRQRHLRHADTYTSFCLTQGLLFSYNERNDIEHKC